MATAGIIYYNNLKSYMAINEGQIILKRNSDTSYIICLRTSHRDDDILAYYNHGKFFDPLDMSKEFNSMSDITYDLRNINLNVNEEIKIDVEDLNGTYVVTFREKENEIIVDNIILLNNEIFTKELCSAYKMIGHFYTKLLNKIYQKKEESNEEEPVEE